MSTTSDERVLILVGKTGNGKSFTGNSVLGRTIFESKRCLGSITQKCEMQTNFRSDVQRQYTVVDTPGLFDTDKPIADRAMAVQDALEICPKPHVFLIVLSIARFSTDEKLTLDLLHIALGKDFVKHSIVVFTRGSEFESDKEFDEFLKGNKFVMSLIEKCGNRVLRIENSPHFDAIIRGDLLNGLFNTIEKLSEGGLLYYQYKSLSIHRRCLEKHLSDKRDYLDLGDELNHLAYNIVDEVEQERRRLQEEHQRKLKHEQEKMERQLEEKEREFEKQKVEELCQQKLEHEAAQRKMEETNRQLEREKNEEIRKMLEKRARELKQEAKNRKEIEKQREEERQKSNEEIRHQRELLQQRDEHNRQNDEDQRQKNEEFNNHMMQMREAMEYEREMKQKELAMKEAESGAKIAILKKQLEIMNANPCAIM